MVIMCIVWRAVKFRQMQQMNNQAAAAVPNNVNMNINPYQAYQNNLHTNLVQTNPHQNQDIYYGQPINPGTPRQNVYIIKPNPVQPGGYNPSDPVAQSNAIVQPGIPVSYSK